MYGPEHWIPHITLAQWDLTPRQLPALMQVLSARSFSWRVSITNLTVIETASDALDAPYAIASQVTLERENDKIDD